MKENSVFGKQPEIIILDISDVYKIKLQIGQGDAITLLSAPFICLSLLFCLNFSVNDRWLHGFSVVQNWLWVLRAPDWHSVLCILCLCLALPQLSCCRPVCLGQACAQRCQICEYFKHTNISTYSHSHICQCKPWSESRNFLLWAWKILLFMINYKWVNKNIDEILWTQLFF